MAGIVWAVFAAAFAAGAEASITEIAPTAAITNPSPVAINDAGVVVGNSDQGAFRWSAGVFTRLPALTASGTAAATDINASGQILGVSTDGTGASYTVQTVIWSPDTLLPTALACFAPGNCGRGAALSDSGVATGTSYDARGIQDAVVWSNGSAAQVGTNPGVGMDVSGRGSLVGFDYALGKMVIRPGSAAGQPQPNAGATPIDNCFVAAQVGIKVNDANEVAGTGPIAGAPGPSFRPQHWKDGVCTNLPQRPGDTSGFATAISNAGVIVGQTQAAGAGSVGVEWRADDTLVDLNTLLPAGSGWTITSASDINESGQILGQGLHNGQSRAFVLSPDVALSVADAHAAPPATGSAPMTFVISLDGRASAPVSVDYATHDGIGPTGATTAANDYTATSGTVTFAPGETQKTVAVPINHVDTDDHAKTFTLDLSGESGAIVARRSATGTIQARHTLSGTVVDSRGHGIAQTTIKIVAGSGATTNALTDATGRFTTRLGEDTYTVTPQPAGSTTPQRSADCVGPLRDGCQVSLDRDRDVKFVLACVQPKPDGSPLPADTPDPIPGAQRFGSLEAVGCFGQESDGTYSSDRPVRLNGLDVVPDTGAKIVLNSRLQSATSTGPATLFVGGYPLAYIGHLNLNYSGSNVKPNDLSSPVPVRFPFANLYGIPLVGPAGRLLGAANTGVVLRSFPGESTMQANLTVPIDLASQYDPISGKFAPVDPLASPLASKTTPQVNLSVTLKLSNRGGFESPKFCAGAAEFRVLNLTSKFELCGTADGRKWSAKGQMDLPFLLRNGSRPKLTLAAELAGHRLESAAFEVDRINQPIAEGVFAQRLRGSARGNLLHGGEWSVGAGISFGPRIYNNGSNGVSRFDFELASMDATGTLHSSPDPPFLRLDGDIKLLRGTSFETRLANAYWLLRPGRIDFGGHIGFQDPFDGHVFRAEGDLNGWYDQRRDHVELEGNGLLEVAGHNTGVQIFVSEDGIAVCHGPEGARSGFFRAFHEEYASSFHVLSAGLCDVGAYRRSTSNSAHASAAAGRGFTVARGARATYLRIRGAGAAPRVTLHGPHGSTVHSPAGARVIVNRHVFLMPEKSTDTTAVELVAPIAGRWTITAQPGSAPITSVLQASPAPRSRVRAHVVSAGCRRAVRYVVGRAPGDRVELYAQGGDKRRYLGNVSGHGTKTFSGITATGGAGKVIAVVRRGRLTRSLHTVATYRVVDATPLPAPTHLKIIRRGSRRTITWRGSCAAKGYDVQLIVKRHTIERVIRATRLTLPHGRSHGTAYVTPLGDKRAAGQAAHLRF